MRGFLSRLRECALLKRVASELALLKTLLMCVIAGALFGGVEGHILAQTITMPALFGAMCGLVTSACASGINRLLRLTRVNRVACIVLTVLIFCLSGPLMVGFITAHVAGMDPPGDLGAIAVLVVLGPLVMGVWFGLVGARHARSY